MLGKRANAEEESGRLVETPINCSNNGARSLVTTDIYCSQCCKLRSFERWNQSPIIVHSTRQHGTTWRADHRLFHPSTRYHMADRSSSIPPVNTVPHGGQIIVYSVVPHCGQIIVYSVSQHSTTWRSDYRLFRQSTQYHMVVR